MDLPDTVNKSPIPNKLKKIRCYINNHIHRIQFSIRRNLDNYDELKEMFDNEFEYLKTFRKDKDTEQDRLINQYKFQSSEIELVLYMTPGKHYWFSVVLQDPNIIPVSVIRDMLQNLPDSEITISQVEFTWDFYPESKPDLILIYIFINNHLYLKSSREKSYHKHFSKETNSFTQYQGKCGNIRRGSKGSRVYLRPKAPEKPEFVRVELQANRGKCKDLKFDLTSLPIDPAIIRFSDYFEFRHRLNQSDLYKLTNTIFRKRYRNHKSIKGLGRRTLLSFLKDDVCQSILLHDKCYLWSSENDSVPVADQINRFKLIKKIHKLSYGISFFRQFSPLQMSLKKNKGIFVIGQK